MRRAPRGARVAGTVAVAAFVLAGCAGNTAPAADGEAGVTRTPATTAPATPASPVPSASPSAGPTATRTPHPSAAPTSPSSPAPSLPPGDPGLDAPTAADPGTAGVAPHADEALRVVPADALVGPGEAASLLGGRWSAAAGSGDACARPATWVGRRTVALAGGRTSVVETVSTHADDDAADAAVAGLRTRLPDCGWDLGEDPRLGSASLTATRGDRRLGVVSVEGVTVVLLGRGPRADGFGWDGLLDVAMGTSCAATAHGCH